MRISSLLIAVLATFFFANHAFATDKKFFGDIQGIWSGPGEIVAGKYKGTKFVCTFSGIKPRAKVGMEIDGSCRVGVFSQPMNAVIIKSAGSYVGKFLDGEDGKGMDVIGARYTRGRLVASIKRNELEGVMVANLSDSNALKITVSVKHKGGFIPVIGMNLGRKSDSSVTGSIR